MEFNFGLCSRVTYLSLFESQATDARLTWKRVAGLGAFCDPLEAHPFRDSTLAITKHWYDYTIRQLELGPASSYLVVRYDDLVKDLDATITRTYAGFGFQITPGYAAALQEEVEKARRCESRHEYLLPEMGLTREQTAVEYRDVMARFGFDTG